MNPMQRQIRLLRLTAANVALAAVPLITVPIPPLSEWLWIHVGLVGLSMAPWMLLCVWCALGNSCVKWRIVGWLVSLLYLAALATLREWLYVLTRPYTSGGLDSSDFPEPAYFSAFVQTFLFAAIQFGVWIGVLLIFRQRRGSLSVASGRSATIGSHRQFGIATLLVVTFLVGVFLALGRIAQMPPSAEGSDWKGLAQQCLWVLVFAVAALLGLQTVFGSRPSYWSVGLALCAGSFTLSSMYAVTVAASDIDWAVPLDVGRSLVWGWLLVGLPSVAFGASLFVVRSCGYRLVPHETSRSMGA